MTICANYHVKFSQMALYANYHIKYNQMTIMQVIMLSIAKWL